MPATISWTWAGHRSTRPCSPRPIWRASWRFGIWTLIQRFLKLNILKNFKFNLQIPISSIQVGTGADSALNRLSWHSQGAMIATGSQNGSVRVFELSDTIAQPAVEESARLNQTLSDMYQTLEEQSGGSGANSATKQPGHPGTKRFDLWLTIKITHKKQGRERSSTFLILK